MPVTGSGGNLQCLEVGGLENLRDAVVARRGNGNDVAGHANRAYGGRQGFLATAGDDYVGRGQAAARINGQPSDLFTQCQYALDVVVLQACAVTAPADTGHCGQQRLEGGRGYIRHAATQLNGTGTLIEAHQLPNHVPLGNVHRPQDRTVHLR